MEAQLAEKDAELQKLARRTLELIAETMAHKQMMSMKVGIFLSCLPEEAGASAWEKVKELGLADK